MSAAIADVVAVRVPERSWRSEWRAVSAIWRREMIRFLGDRNHMVMWLIQPLLFLLVLGPGLGLEQFMFPGALCMAATFAGMFSAASLVWDRELGFLRELTVAPVSRASIIAGKCLGGATIASSQGAVVLALAGLVGVPYRPGLILGVFALLLLISFTMTAFGLLVAVRIKRAQTFTFVNQMLVMPMFFASGAFFPVDELPDWLGVLNRIDPLTYAVDPMRHLIEDDHPGVTWFGWQLPPAFEAAMVLVLGLAFLTAAIHHFTRTD